MELTSNLKQITQCQRELEIRIPAESVNEEWRRIIKKFSMRSKIKGFREGKAPPELVKRIYYEEIKNELINSLIPKALSKIFEEKKLNPINSPVIKRIDFEEGKPLSFLAFFEVLPDFEVKKYRGIEVQKKKIEVTQEEIQDYIKRLQEQHSEFVPSKRKIVKTGDYVVIQIEAFNLIEKKQLPKEKIVVIAGNASNAPELNENLIGAKINEERVFNINYPENHENKDLAGKKIKYKIKILTIKERKLPKIDNDFAKSLGDYENLADLKKEIKEKIKRAKESSTKEQMINEILGKISEKVNFEVPETLVEVELNDIIKNIISQYPNREFEKEEIEELASKYKLQAERNVKNYLILNKIAQQENINVRDEEVEEEIKALADKKNLPFSFLKREIEEKNGIENFKKNILLKKTVDFLLKQAIIKNRVKT